MYTKQSYTFRWNAYQKKYTLGSIEMERERNKSRQIVIKAELKIF